jgi:sugar phosphate isomerase/epimerase
MTRISRRGLIAGGAGLAAASLVPGRGAVAPAEAASLTSAPRASLFPPERIGLQLYSVQDQISAQGFAKVLPELAGIGYKLVEFAGYTDSTDITVPQLRRLLDDNGLKAIGSHVSPSDDESMKKILEDAAVLGIPNVGISLPLPEQGPTVAGWSALSKTYNHWGELASKAGVGFYLHNHFHEWFPCPDDPSKRGEDVFLAETDPRYVFFEMDIYWAHVGMSQSKATPFDALLDYAIPHRDRYRLFHVKDGKQNSFGTYDDAFTNIVDAGQGSIDFQAFFDKLFSVAPDQVTKHHYIWERDNAGDHPRGSIASARSSFTYIRYGLYGESAGTAPATGADVPGAVTAVAFRRLKTGRRVLRVTIETDQTVKATLGLKRGNKVLVRNRSRTLKAGRHTMDLRLPRTARAGRAQLVTRLGSHTSKLPVMVPAGR